MAASLAGTFRFDGKEVPIEDGDTIGSALHRAGVRTISRSMKYHRPRGLYCCTGSCASCLVAVDGVPNLPACMQEASDGARVESQNRIGTARHDLLGATDTVFSEGFEPHQAFTRPRLLNALFLRAVRFMSGWGNAPKADVRTDGSPRRHVHHVDEVIIGGGLHGLRRAKHAAGSGRVLLVEELPVLGGSAAWDPTETEAQVLAEAAPIWEGVEVWTDAVAFGIYGDAVAVRRGKDLHEVTADRITIAPGRHDGQPVFENNDRPGILSLRGARRLWYGHGVLPGRRIVVHGGPLPTDLLRDLAAAGASVVATGDVAAAEGNPVKRARIGNTWHACDTILCNVPGVPRIELFQQAGCTLGWDDGLRPVTAADGATSRPDVFAGATP